MPPRFRGLALPASVRRERTYQLVRTRVRFFGGVHRTAPHRMPERAPPWTGPDARGLATLRVQPAWRAPNHRVHQVLGGDLRSTVHRPGLPGPDSADAGVGDRGALSVTRVCGTPQSQGTSPGRGRPEPRSLPLPPSAGGWLALHGLLTKPAVRQDNSAEWLWKRGCGTHLWRERVPQPSTMTKQGSPGTSTSPRSTGGAGGVY